MTLEQLREYIQYSNSYTRLLDMLNCYEDCAAADWLRVIGEEWQSCDNIGFHKAALLGILPRSTEPLMMTHEEMAELDALPDMLMVYRGADRGVNECGLSWSLDREVAAQFPFLGRYQASNPVLVVGHVSKRHVVALKNGREERELIIMAVVSIECVHALDKAEGGATVSVVPSTRTDAS